MFVALVLLAGVVLVLAGYFGPQDGGAVEIVGLVLIAIAIWKGISWR